MFYISGCALNEPVSLIDLSDPSAENPNTPGTTSVPSPTLEFNIGGTYICTADQFSNDEFFFSYPMAIECIAFYKNGRCIIRGNYWEGTHDIAGDYSVDGDNVLVKLDLDAQDTFLQRGDDELFFYIISDDEIIIDRPFYSSAAGDSFRCQTLASIEQGKPGIIEADVVKYGFRQYTATLSTLKTEEWIGFTNSPTDDIIRFTIILPDGYEMNNFTFYNINNLPNTDEKGEIRSPVKLHEEQQMPCNIETLQKFEDEFWAEHESRVDPGSFPYYGGKNVSFSGREIFMAHRDLQTFYQHVLYMTLDEYVFMINFCSQKKYPETEQVELFDSYIGIIASIEIVEVIVPDTM